MTLDAQEKCAVLCESSIKHRQNVGQNASEELVDLESQIGRADTPTPPKCKKLDRCNAVAVVEILDYRYK